MSRGSIYRRGDGYAVHLSWREGGRQRQHKRQGFTNRKAAEKYLTELLRRLDLGDAVAARKGTLARHLTDWLAATSPTVKPSTHDSYRLAVERYIVPNLGDLELARLDGARIGRFYALLLAEGRTGAGGRGRSGGLAPKTVRNIAGALHKALDDAVRWGLIPRNPADRVELPRGRQTEPTSWSAEETARFLTVADDDRLAAVWRLLLVAGARRGEVLGLTWPRVDLEAGSVTIVDTRLLVGGRIISEDPKTAAGRRTIALDAATVAALRRWKAAQAAERLLMGAGWQGVDGLVVTEGDGRGVHPRTFSRRFKVLAARAGVPVIRLHDTRHTSATIALEAGTPVKVVAHRLGHADAAMTLRVYAHALPAADQDAADRIADLFDRAKVGKR